MTTPAQITTAPASNTRQGFPSRWLSRYTTAPHGIFDPRTIKFANSSWVEIGGLSTTIEH